MADAGRRSPSDTKFEVRIALPFGRYDARCVSTLMVTLTFDLSTLKLVCESYPMWRTFRPNLDTLGLLVLELFAMYATDGRHKQRLLSLSLRAVHIKTLIVSTRYILC